MVAYLDKFAKWFLLYENAGILICEMKVLLNSPINTKSAHVQKMVCRP